MAGVQEIVTMPFESVVTVEPFAGVSVEVPVEPASDEEHVV